MMGKTHKIGGLLAGAVVSKIFYSDDWVTTSICVGALIVGSVLGSLLPDIDKKESTIGRILWFISWPIYLLRMIIKLFAKIFPGIIKKVFQELDEDLGHRGVAHSLFTWAGLTVILWFSQSVLLRWILTLLHRLINDFKWFPWDLQLTDTLTIRNGIFSFLLGVSLGMLSHIVLDLFTTGGVALFSPFIDTKFEIPIINIRTGGFIETSIRGVMAVAVILLAYKDIVTYVKT